MDCGPCSKPLPLPEAREDNSDTAWELFQSLHRPPGRAYAPTSLASLPMPLPKGDPRYAPTVPQALVERREKAAPPKARAKPAVGVAEVMNEARRHGRICPLPVAWQALYQMLPGKVEGPHGWQPPPPLTGSAWKRTPSLAKRMCLKDHIEWAAAQDCLDEVYAFLKELPETDWHHLD